MISMSKSKYCKGVQCPKILWMDVNMPEKANVVASEAIFRTGTEVGMLARDYFGKHVAVEFDFDKNKMCQETKAYIEAGNTIIAEASFMYENNFCSVDVLKIENGKAQLIEVKSSTEVQDIYYDDMAYQYYVLTHCGICVEHVINMHINNEYVRQGELNLNDLFTLEDCTEVILSKQDEVEENLRKIHICVEESLEPNVGLECHCDKPYECQYKAYCHRDIPEPSVFSIYRLKTKT